MLSNPRLRTASLLACCALAACGQTLSSDYHGKWSCGVSGTYEISGSSVVGPFRNQRSDIEAIKDYDGGKYVGMRNGSALVSLALRREGARLYIDGIACTRA